ncbi:MAG: 30S ribosomal protein S16 [Phycisphaerales bacterium]
MVRLRLSRMGRPHRPFYRLGAVDQRTKRDGKVIEALGWYDPMALDKSKQIHLNVERIKHWLKAGAQPSETVTDLLIANNVIDGVARKAQITARIEAKKAAAAKAAANASGGKKDEKK